MDQDRLNAVLGVVRAVRASDWKLDASNLDHTQENVPSYMLAPVESYVRHGAPLGGFLTAVFRNDLKLAACLADANNARALRAWAKLLYNRVPRECQGSAETIAYWLAAHAQLRDEAATTKGSVACSDSP